MPHGSLACCVNRRLIYLNELDAVKHARVRWLTCHLKLELICLEVLARFWVDLCHGLQKHDSAETFESKPVNSLDINIQLFAALIEAF